MSLEHPYDESDELVEFNDNDKTLDPTMKSPLHGKGRDDAQYAEIIEQLNTIIRSNNNLVRENTILRKKIVDMERRERSTRQSMQRLETMQVNMSRTMIEISKIIDKLDNHGIIPKS